MKNPFTQYTEKLESEVSVKVTHKLKLARKLFESKKKPFWTWTKAIFTAPVVAVIAIIFFLNSNQETVKQVLLPQQALAQALENTFDLKVSETFFGLPINDELNYRKLITRYYDSAESIYYTQEKQFWVRGQNTRVDKFEYKSDNPEKIYPWSELVNTDEKFTCLTQKYEKPQCLPPEEIGRLEYTPFIKVVDYFFPKSKENYIYDLNFKKAEDYSNDAFGYITFTTAQQINQGEIFYGPSMVGGNLFNMKFNEALSDAENWRSYSEDENFYINKSENGKYRHQIKVQLFVSRLFDLYEKIYFQVRDVSSNVNLSESVSRVYEIDIENDKVEPIIFDSLYSGIQKFILETEMQNDNPLVYMLRNFNEFSEPINIEEYHYQDQLIEKFVYPLKKTYFSALEYTPYTRHPIKDETDYFIDILIDIKTMRFVGYNLREEDFELESFRIEDQILLPEEATSIFNKEKWLEEYLPYKWGIDY